MSTSPKETQSNIAALFSELGVEPGADGFYIGTAGCAPFLVKILEDAYPPIIMFKVRMVDGRDEASDWVSGFGVGYQLAEVSCEIEDGYLFLWIHKPDQLDATGMIELFRRCVDDHAALFQSELDYCHRCRQGVPSRVIQSKGTIGTLCEPCYEQVAELKERIDTVLNRSSPGLAILLPVAVCFAALGWGYFWAGYAVMIDKQDGVLFVPVFVAGVVVVVFGSLLGWPTGKILHRSGIVKRIPRGLLVFLVAAGTPVAGEYVVSALLVKHHTGSIDLQLAMKLFPEVFAGGGFTTSAMKCIFLGFFCHSVDQTARPKDNHMDI